MGKYNSLFWYVQLLTCHSLLYTHIQSGILGTSTTRAISTIKIIIIDKNDENSKSTWDHFAMVNRESKLSQNTFRNNDI